MRPALAVRTLCGAQFSSYCLRNVRSPVRRPFSTTFQGREEARKWSTPLAKQLYEAITTTGPVPLASYMRMCLTGDIGGYYTSAVGGDRDQFGTKGDFVTSPEISQIFGELIGIWFVAEWMSQGRPRQGIQLIEVGPGRGTLMDDVLRTIQRFPDLANGIQAVYMVEASQELREKQKRLLCGPEASTTESKVGCHSTGRYGGIPIVWTDMIKSIPIESDKTPFIIAHEFFDALPIYAFQSAPASSTSSTKDSSPTTGKSSQPRQAEPSSNMEWRELMVTPTNLIQPGSGLSGQEASSSSIPPEFQLVLSTTTTRHSRYVPESSPRYRKLKQIPDSTIEVCPEASLYATDFAARIGGSAKQPKSKPSGAALILDYGTLDTVPINSLRGIRNHKIVNPFSMPGQVDLSADVDFSAIADTALSASEGIEVHGPVVQGDFLELMGIRQRAEMLTKAPGLSKEQIGKMNGAWKRLINKGPNGMGKIYKALAILPENSGRRKPVGFGGDVKTKIA